MKGMLKMKKLAAVALVIALVAGLCACGAKNNEPTFTSRIDIETTPENTEHMVVHSETAQEDGQEHYGVDAENLAEMLHKVALWVPGTAGSELKKAEAAFAVLRYAVVHNLYVLDEDYLDIIMKKAKFDLYNDERDRLEDNMDKNKDDNVYALVMQALSDYDSVKSLFEDVGAAEMSDYVYSVRAAESFEKLADEINYNKI
ncbi:MAG: hypothetical protein J5870_00300 [Clostridia bacterium]|nr:hypothetical protein [Clostridia bacterium]